MMVRQQEPIVPDQEHAATRAHYEALADQVHRDLQLADLDRRIALLKDIRRQCLELCTLTQTFSVSLFDTFSAPRSKIDAALASLLLKRELRGDQ